MKSAVTLLIILNSEAENQPQILLILLKRLQKVTTTVRQSINKQETGQTQLHC